MSSETKVERLPLEDKATRQHCVVRKKKLYLRDTKDPKVWKYIPHDEGRGFLQEPNNGKCLRVKNEKVKVGTLTETERRKNTQAYLFVKQFSLKHDGLFIFQEKDKDDTKDKERHYLSKNDKGEIVVTTNDSKAVCWVIN